MADDVSDITLRNLDKPKGLGSIKDLEINGVNLLNAMYPVGSIYIGTTDYCPIAALGVGTWELVGADKVLQGAGTRGSVGTTLSESLPNITGNTGNPKTLTNTQEIGTPQGALYVYSQTSNDYGHTTQGSSGRWALGFDASRSSSIYQDNAPVQPDAYLVNIWKRTA